MLFFFPIVKQFSAIITSNHFSDFFFSLFPFWDLYGAIPKGWGASYRMPTACSSERGTSLVRSLSIECCCVEGEVFCETMSLPPLPVSMWSFHPLLKRVVHRLFTSFSYVTVTLVCPGKKVSSENFSKEAALGFLRYKVLDQAPVFMLAVKDEASKILFNCCVKVVISIVNLVIGIIKQPIF